DALSGIAYPGLIDPRIDALMARSGSNPIYSGIPNGFGNTTNNTNFTDATFFGKKSSPLLIGSYAEQKLMEAEALFLANGGTATSIGSTQAAYDAYIEGISANFKYLGIASTAYISNPQVAVTPAGLTLELILRERQIALYLNPEAWTDTRRYDYNPNLFRGMALPVNHNPELGGNYIRRALYPLDEINRNPNSQAALKLLSDKVWWDQ
ncbi:MAG TPA: SusD/RagB family nutrient-binding outer membrane lipoprotein, partial [Chitinophagaceae bacterium]|nr:SusD/RagB family nutrient-binding outer membrane lipoprotein [Chitinophagaceae bacterium]